MLFSIFNLFFNAIIVVLLIRYFIEPYRFYGFGPILVGIISITEKVIRPLRNLLPRTALTLQDQMPLLAIVVVLVLRGLFIWILDPRYAYRLPVFTPDSFLMRLILSMSISFTMGVLLVGGLLIVLLFASLMISRRGLTLAGNAGFACFQEKTFSIFQYTQRLTKTSNLVTLFAISASVILLATAFLASVTSLSFLMGPAALYRTFVMAVLDILAAILNIYWFILLLAILASWIGADRFSTVVQIVQAMSGPYLDFFRRIMPWARVDFVDLSPVFAFLALMLVVAGLNSIQAHMLFGW